MLYTCCMSISTNMPVEWLVQLLGSLTMTQWRCNGFFWLIISQYYHDNDNIMNTNIQYKFM